MIYFILPIYNEEKNIRQVIADIRQWMLQDDYRIIAVNDGSSDRSGEILNELKAGDLIFESSLINMNVGAVFSRGIHRALSEAKPDDVLIIMESDQTSELDLIHKLIARIREQNQDIVIASRYQPGGAYVRFPWMRKVFSKSVNYLMRKLFPIKEVSDYTIFFRAYRIGIFQEALKYFGPFGLIQSKGFVANAELLVKLALFTDKIAEVPFVYDYGNKKGISKIGVLRTINEYFVLVNYLQRIAQKVRVERSRTLEKFALQLPQDRKKHARG